MRRFASGLRRWFPPMTPFVKAILIACVAIHAAVLLIGFISPGFQRIVLGIGTLTPRYLFLKPWSIVTMAFLHAPNSLFHILFNMVALASIGPWLERALGTARFAQLYIIAMLTGSVVFIVHTLLFSFSATPPLSALGASGAIMGIIVGFGFVFPEAELRLFGIAPFKAKNIVWLAIGMDTLAVIAGANIAVTVHAGGMLGAWGFLRRPWNRRYWNWIRVRTTAKVNWLKMKYRFWKMRNR